MKNAETSFDDLKPDQFWKRGTKGHPYNSERRWLWWPLSFGWSDRSSSAWFCRHGVQMFTREQIVERFPSVGILCVKYLNYTAQVWHLGRFKIRFGIR